MNMKKIVEYKMSDGNSVCIEIDEPTPQGVAPVSRTSDAIKNAQELLEDALAKIKPFARAVVSPLSDLRWDWIVASVHAPMPKSHGIFPLSRKANDCARV